MPQKIHPTFLRRLSGFVLFHFFLVVQYIFPFIFQFSGSIFQSSLSKTGWFNRFVTKVVPRRALVNGKCPFCAFLRSYVNSDAPNQRFFRSTSPSSVVQPILRQNSSKSFLQSFKVYFLFG